MPEASSSTAIACLYLRRSLLRSASTGHSRLGRPRRSRTPSRLSASVERAPFPDGLVGPSPSAELRWGSCPSRSECGATSVTLAPAIRPSAVSADGICARERVSARGLCPFRLSPPRWSFDVAISVSLPHNYDGISTFYGCPRALG